MGRKEAEKVVRVEFEDLNTPENEAKCPGFLIIEKGEGHDIQPCNGNHKHRQRRKITYFEEGPLKVDYVPSYVSGRKPQGAFRPPTARDAENTQQAIQRIKQEIRAKLPIKRIPRVPQEGEPFHMKPSPNVETTEAPANLETSATVCRCGKPLVKADWSSLGVTGSPKICSECKDLPTQCSCGQTFRDPPEVGVESEIHHHKPEPEEDPIPF